MEGVGARRAGAEEEMSKWSWSPSPKCCFIFDIFVAVCNYCARSRRRFSAAGPENKPAELWLSAVAIASKRSTEFKQLRVFSHLERTKISPS